MASSLGAAIQNRFGVAANLVEGHNGIYEVTVNDKVIYSNQGSCSSGFPTDEEVFQEIRQYREPLPGFAETMNADGQEIGAPSCSWSPPVTKAESEPSSCGCSNGAKEEPEPSSCGCSTDVVESTAVADSSCCTAPISNVRFGDDSIVSSCCA